MDTFDPIPDLVRIGYTLREAGFLTLVGRLSGYFLGRQYCAFLRRKPGATVYQLVEKATTWQHIQVLDFGQHRYVYHLKSKLVYELLQCPESQNRRPKGDDEIRTRLMVLDYVLENLDSRFLALRAEKQAYLRAETGIDLPTLASFVDRFPIFLVTQGEREVPQFTYFDPGTTTVKPFVRYLRTLAPAVEKLDRFELRYGALSLRNFAAAEAAFFKEFPEIKIPKTHLLLPYGAEHLSNFFRAQRLWDENSPHFQQEDLAILREGEQIYVRPEHERFRTALQRGRDEYRREIAQLCGIKQMNGVFSTEVLDGAFPLFRCRQRGDQAATTVLEVAV